MNLFIKGVLLGVLSASAIYFSLAYADSNQESEDRQLTDEEFEQLKQLQQPDLLGRSKRSCTVSVMRGRRTPGNVCRFSDEVMTGIDSSGTVLCSRLYVNCN